MAYRAGTNGLRDLTVLTPGERFWLDRYRRGESQAQAGYRLGIPERRYNHIETDRLVMPKVPRLKPTRAEQCVLARRRDGRSLRALAGVLGAGSHVTLLAWESAANPRLVAAWVDIGFRFE